MEAIKPEEIATNAIEMFNALSKAHNKMIDQFVRQGLTKERAALASYMAIRTMLARFVSPVEACLSVDSRSAVETIIRLMITHHEDEQTPPVPSALA